MKKLLLHIILFSYAIVIFKPALPYLMDAVNHLVFFKQHMATVHLENGKYHLHAEVSKNAKEDNTAKNLPSFKKENTSTDHAFFTTKTDEVIAITIGNDFTMLANDNLAAANVQHDYPPPRF